MKKYVTVILFLSAVCLFAQAKGTPFSGYDNMPWGTKVNTFLKMNPTAIEFTPPEDLAIDHKLFSVSVYSDGVKERQYEFFNDQLYDVTVFYDDNRYREYFLGVASRLTDLYGAANDKRTATVNSVDVSEYEEVSVLFWFLKPDLTVKYYFRVIYNKQRGYLRGYSCMVSYTNPVIYTLVKQTKEKKAKGKVQL
jgi:hypothetical protein